MIKASTERQTAPSFDLEDSKGASVTLRSFRGRVVLMNFWATWCGPCNHELPWFEEFENAYKNRGFEVLGVSVDEDGWKAVTPYVEGRNLTYPMVLGTETLLREYGGIDSLPVTFIIDRKGRIAVAHKALASKDTYRSKIEELIGEP